MNVLALDTSTGKIVVALMKGEERIFCSKSGPEKHATALGPFLKDVLEGMGLSVKEIDLFGLGIGPGNLTGLRIGVATVLGMASVTGAKVVPLNSLELISGNVPNGRRVVVRKARKGYVYAQIFPDDPEPGVYGIPDFGKRLERIDDFILLGDGAPLFEGDRAPEFFWYPLPEILLDLTLARSESAIDYAGVKPLYVQKSIAELNLERRKGNV